MTIKIDARALPPMFDGISPLERATALAASASPSPAQFRNVTSASLPRSGHHLLVRILSELLGAEFGYCEHYTVANCCGMIPCTGAAIGFPGRLFIQKSHDFTLDDPIGSGETLQIVQYRRPIPRLLSDYDVWLSFGGRQTGITFREFAADRAVYSVRFYLKWFAESPAYRFYLQYEKLSADPVKSVDEFLAFAGMKHDARLISAAVEKCIGNDDRGAYRPSDIARHPMYDPELFGLIETFIVSACDTYQPAREFPLRGLSPMQSDLFKAAHVAAARADWAELGGIAHSLLVSNAHRQRRVMRA